MKREPISPYFDIKTDADGHQYMEVYLEGIALLRLVLSNKGTAFTEDERVALGLDGLLPPQVNTLEQQVERVYRGFLREPTRLANTSIYAPCRNGLKPCFTPCWSGIWKK
jgi:malate dehydrogenase (oxaloacetate-decarboxylating)